VRARRDHHSVSSPLRLPEEIQADALRVLDASREVRTLTITARWDRRDECATRTTSSADKHVEERIAAPFAHGHRHWRCEAEQAGRILRGQAERTQPFALIFPLLSQGMIQPKTDTKGAGNNRTAITHALVDLRSANADGGTPVEVHRLIEQACTVSLHNGCVPETSEDMQPLPVLTAGLVPSAGDDGPHRGQTSRRSDDLDQHMLTLALRTPDEQRGWARTWRENTMQMTVPDLVGTRARTGRPLAPTVREMVEADGTRDAVRAVIGEVPVERHTPCEDIQTVLGFDGGVRVLVTASVVDRDGNQRGRPFVVDTGPFDGRQARVRRQVDQRTATVARREQHRDRFPSGDPRRTPSEDALPIVRRESNRC
jgi:putative transposase